jgi:Kef-type K+ transport system membrane component KefB
MPVIIPICILLLLAYVFDLSSKFTKIPSVILLIAMGFIVKQITLLFHVKIPDLNGVLPVLGTIGLILIVLEGSLELEVSKDKNGMILKSLFLALFPMLLLTALIAWIFSLLTDANAFDSILNAIPLGVISSAIAIPSVKNLGKENKDFIVYESSLSDILGVLFFNFFALNNKINLSAFTGFGSQILLMFFLAFIATLALSILLNNIKHRVKFAPIILLVLLIYEVSHIFHLPALIFVLIFGLFLGNIDQLERFNWIQKLRPQALKQEVHKFTDLVMEAAFIVRASFFILFGYMLQLNEILNPSTILLALMILFSIIFFRILFLLLFKLPVLPLMFIAPRGLITILLFLNIPALHYLPIINKSLVIQVVLLTALWMMIGLMVSNPIKKHLEIDVKPPVPPKPIQPTDPGSKPDSIA